ncbi:hypothetical protein CCAX7_007280 [Capsulimonas corticalis]|uniref:Uncharacterized protein n=1 Tax=Capsulimonas corticalis TaxID=2219043 RepID=A0A402D1L6_9BACT|nr:M56 family metallopeptidase [Capsulimonas corticalis]BDI28677.1 hypothetical protein CCAX7_007280 [Capsulimonas corticalis]
MNGSLYSIAIQHWGLPAQRLLLALADVSAKSILLFLAAGVLVLALRQASAARKHLIWLLCLAGMLALPLFTALIPGREVQAVQQAFHVDVIQAKQTPDKDAPKPVPASSGIASVNGAPSPAAVTRRTHESQQDSARNRPLPFDAWKIVIGFMALCYTFFWALGILVVFARMGFALLRLRWLQKTLTPITHEPTVRIAAHVAAQMGWKRPILLYEGDAVATPITWGARSPIVALPLAAREWPEARLRAALLHEFAHIQRGDWLAQMLAFSVCALYWFHPCAWLAARFMRQQCEHAADDYAVTHGLKASDYAAELLEIARSLQSRRSPRFAVAMAPRPRIEARLRAILAADQRRDPVTKRLWKGGLAATACLLLLGSAVRFSSRATGTPGIDRPASAPSPWDNAIVAPAPDAPVTLPNGAVIRLAGVADTQGNPNHWWSPSGGPVAQSLLKNTLIYPSMPSGAQGRVFAASIQYDVHKQPMASGAPPPPWDWVYLHSPEYGAVYYTKPTLMDRIEPKLEKPDLSRFQEHETRSGAAVTYQMLDSAPIAASARTATVRVACAAGLWTGKIRCKKTAGKIYIEMPGGPVIFTLVSNPHHLKDAKALARANAIVGVSDYFGSAEVDGVMREVRNFDRDVVALDSGGRAIYDIKGYSMPSGAGKTEQQGLIPIPILNRTAAFELRARPYYWAEFRNIRLKSQ